jgi:hypothetical protein
MPGQYDNLLYRIASSEATCILLPPLAAYNAVLEVFFRYSPAAASLRSGSAIGLTRISWFSNKRARGFTPELTDFNTHANPSLMLSSSLSLKLSGKMMISLE